jgi:hypothetical protein
MGKAKTDKLSQQDWLLIFFSVTIAAMWTLAGYFSYGTMEVRSKGIDPFVLIIIASNALILGYSNRENAFKRFLVHEILLVSMFILGIVFLVKSSSSELSNYIAMNSGSDGVIYRGLYIILAFFSRAFYLMFTKVFLNKFPRFKKVSSIIILIGFTVLGFRYIRHIENSHTNFYKKKIKKINERSVENIKEKYTEEQLQFNSDLDACSKFNFIGSEVQFRDKLVLTNKVQNIKLSQKYLFPEIFFGESIVGDSFFESKQALTISNCIYENNRNVVSLKHEGKKIKMFLEAFMFANKKIIKNELAMMDFILVDKDISFQSAVIVASGLPSYLNTKIYKVSKVKLNNKITNSSELSCMSCKVLLDKLGSDTSFKILPKGSRFRVTGVFSAYVLNDEYFIDDSLTSVSAMSNAESTLKNEKVKLVKFYTLKDLDGNEFEMEKDLFSKLNNKYFAKKSEETLFYYNKVREEYIDKNYIEAELCMYSKDKVLQFKEKLKQFGLDKKVKLNILFNKGENKLITYEKKSHVCTSITISDLDAALKYSLVIYINKSYIHYFQRDYEPWKKKKVFTLNKLINSFNLL